MMKAGAALVLAADPGVAAAEAVAQATTALGDTPPALAVLFASAHFLAAAEELLAAIAEQAGELGPVGSQNFLRTFTASLALFPDRAPDA
jgi:small ligand-binding sensory domain FIST